MYNYDIKMFISIRNGVIMAEELNTDDSDLTPLPLISIEFE